MTRIGTVYLLPVFVALLMLASSAMGQFKETYEPPGYILEWGSNGSGPGQFDSPRGVATDKDGNVYVADSGNKRIQKFDAAGNYLFEFGRFPLILALVSPNDVFVADSGLVYVADGDAHRIRVYNSEGLHINTWGGLGSGPGQFNQPWGVAVDASSNVYVSDRFNDRIQKFDSAGNYLTQWGSEGSGAGQFDTPSGISVDSFGNVYVADGINHRVQKFDSVGNYLTEWGGLGSGPGQLTNPYDLAVDAFDYVYVTDFHFRVQRFSSSGRFVTSFDGPEGWVAVDSFGNVYQVDGFNDRIQKFSPVLWFDVAGYDSYLSVATMHEDIAVRTLFQLENNGAPRFAFRNTNSDTEWSFQQSGPGNFLISKEGTGGPELQVYQSGMVRMGPGGANNFTLSPNGNLTIAGSLTANGSTFPDYVFESDYPLMPLSELRTFVQQEKRLPDIPSAQEVKEQGGHNMTELQLKMLEKIEELTLYTLEQDQQLSQEDLRIELVEARLAAIEAMLSDQ